MKTATSVAHEIVVGIFTAVVCVLIVAFIVFLIPQRPTLPVSPEASKVEKSDRFSISSQGSFSAGYNAHIREILIIKDTKTGKEYLGVTGVGVTEIVGSGKTVTEE